MLSAENNELLTRVEGDAPMGRMMRENYWIPFSLTSELVADGAPKRVRLLGRNYVAFRATDGRLGFFNERCPHRGVSLALGRNECNGLRCIFHGWKFDVTGQTVEITTEPDAERARDFASKVRLKHYPTREAGGLVWVWLGEAAEPPFPSLPFVGEHEKNNWLTVSRARCNWLQGVEGTLDSVHVGTLHNTYISSYVKRTAGAGTGKLTLNNAPRYEVDATDYGLRAAALRALADGGTYVRATEHFVPFVSLVPADRQGDGVIFIATPVDDEHHLLFFGLWSEHQARRPEDGNVFMTRDPVYDRHDFVKLSGDADNNWGQDRTLMAAGHFTGFGTNIVEEDMVVQLSMGPIADRTEEMLSTSDVAIVRLRRLLLDALKADANGEAPPGSALGARPVRVRDPIDAVLGPGVHWQDFASQLAKA